MNFNKVIKILLKEEKSMVNIISDYVKWCENYNKELLKQYPFKSKEFKEKALYVDMNKAMKLYSGDDMKKYNQIKEFYSK